MSRARRHVIGEFKRKAARLCYKLGTVVTQIVRYLGIGNNLLRRWVNWPRLGTDRSRIDDDARKVDVPGGTQLHEQHLVEPIPDAGLLPAAQAPPAADARSATHFGRQNASANAALEHEQYPVSAADRLQLRDPDIGSAVALLAAEVVRSMPQFVVDDWLGHLLVPLVTTVELDSFAFE